MAAQPYPVQYALVFAPTNTAHNLHTMTLFYNVFLLTAFLVNDLVYSSPYPSPAVHISGEVSPEYLQSLFQQADEVIKVRPGEVDTGGVRVNVHDGDSGKHISSNVEHDLTSGGHGYSHGINSIGHGSNIGGVIHGGYNNFHQAKHHSVDVPHGAFFQGGASNHYGSAPLAPPFAHGYQRPKINVIHPVFGPGGHRLGIGGPGGPGLGSSFLFTNPHQEFLFWDTVYRSPPGAPIYPGKWAPRAIASPSSVIIGNHNKGNLYHH